MKNALNSEKTSNNKTKKRVEIMEYKVLSKNIKTTRRKIT